MMWIFGTDSKRIWISITDEYGTMAYLQGMEVCQNRECYYHRYPEKWKSIKDQWVGKFKKLNVNVTVRSTLRDTYTITNPIRRG